MAMGLGPKQGVRMVMGVAAGARGQLERQKLDKRMCRLDRQQRQMTWTEQ